MNKTLIIGAGAAGMAAAIGAAKNGSQVTVLEKNEKCGKKVFITGKGRCNVTNACDIEELFSNIVHNGKFLYSAFYHFSNQDIQDLLEEAGCPLKTERGDRVFPVSDHSSDVIKALERKMKELKVSIKLHTEVKELDISDNKIQGVILKDGTRIGADTVIVATGGLSYPSTGSTGDGYRMAKACGHKVMETGPSLVPLCIKESFCKELQGLALKNVEAQLLLKKNEKSLYSGFGEMLFTHFGVSGPLILSASSYYKTGSSKEECLLRLDLKPALSEEQLDRRICRDFEENQNKQFKNAIGGLFPKRLIPVMIEMSGISPDKKINDITKEERRNFVHRIKNWDLTVAGTREYSEAIITRGGISTKDVNPSTMESKKVSGLYFAGEVLDLDALTGGFNLQIAWSTGYLAGCSVALRKNNGGRNES